MTKKKPYYVKDENGVYRQINELPDFNNVEQLSFTFDNPSEPAEESKEGYSLDSLEFTIDAEDLEAFYKLYDPDDIRDKIVEHVDAIHNIYLNAIYYVAHAENTEDILKTDKISYNDVLKKCHELAELLDLYVESCENEYLIERDPIMKSFLAKDLN